MNHKIIWTTASLSMKSYRDMFHGFLLSRFDCFVERVWNEGEDAAFIRATKATQKFISLRRTRDSIIISGLLSAPPLDVLISKCDRALATRQSCDNNNTSSSLLSTLRCLKFTVAPLVDGGEIARGERASSLAPGMVSYPIADDISICHGLSFVDATAIRGSESLSPPLYRDFIQGRSSRTRQFSDSAFASRNRWLRLCDVRGVNDTTWPDITVLERVFPIKRV